MEDLLDVCSGVVKAGERLGAGEVEIFVARQRSIEACFENNEMKIAKRSVSSAAGIRIFRNHSLGFTSVNSLDPGRLEQALKEAVALSKNAPADANNGLPSPKPLRGVSRLYDGAISEISEEEAIGSAQKMLSSARKVDARVSIDGGKYEAAVGEKAIMNSLGVQGSEEFSAIYYDIGAHAIEGENVSSMDYRFDGTRVMREDDSEGIAVELAGAVIESLSAKKTESFIGSVIFSPLAAIEVLISPILFSVDSNSVQKGISRFGDKMDESVAAKLLTVTDDGTVPAGLSSSTFDREGTPHSPLKIIENGKLNAFLYDAYTARKGGVESNGHAAGSPRGVPSIDATNVFVEPGAKTLDDIISSVDRGLLVQRFSGRVDSVSGDFSGVTKGSKMIDGGSLQETVKETLISGNVYEILTRLNCLSKESKRIMDYNLPHFAVDNISVTGG